jgi:hypothetical protein
LTDWVEDTFPYCFVSVFLSHFSVETRIVIAATWMASLLWERVYLAVAKRVIVPKLRLVGLD